MFVLRRIWLVLVLISGFAGKVPAQDAAVAKGVRLFQAEEYAGAAAVFQDILSEKPGHEAALYYLGRIAYVNKEYKAAEKSFEKAIEANDGVSIYYEWLARSNKQTGYEISRFKRPFHARKMKSNAERAVELDPENTGARLLLLEFYADLPGILGGDRDRAYEQAREIKHRDRAKGCRALIRLYEEDEEYEQAEAEYIELHALLPGDADAVLGLAGVSLRLGRDERGIALVDSTVSLFPEDPSVHWQIAWIAVDTRKLPSRGAASLERYLALSAELDDFDKAYARWMQGRLAEYSGDTTAAILKYEEALELLPKHREAAADLRRLKKQPACFSARE